jgi:hypothetical protein
VLIMSGEYPGARFDKQAEFLKAEKDDEGMA